MFTLDMPDTTGMTGRALEKHVGHRYQHTGNGKVYTIQAVIYYGPLDLWGFLHREAERPDAPLCVRDHVNFFGQHRSGLPRYRKVP